MKKILSGGVASDTKEPKKKVITSSSSRRLGKVENVERTPVLIQL
jgi:hypothetical protein